MNVRSFGIALLSLLAAAPMALAEPATSASTNAAPQTPAEKRALIHQLRDEREKTVRDRGDIFARIATKHDYKGEYVVFRDQDVTAFLDLKDPQHPRYSKSEHDEDEAGGAKAMSHLLVVPNQPRETIGKTLASDITADDLEVTLKVMREAQAIATRFGFKDPKIYIKSPERVGVGYLHVHIVGARAGNAPYPPALR